MRARSSCKRGGRSKFFRLMFGYESLKNYYETNFTLMHHHKYSLNELDNLIPWEKRIYVSMLVSFIKEQNEQMKLAMLQKRRS